MKYNDFFITLAINFLYQDFTSFAKTNQDSAQL